MDSVRHLLTLARLYGAATHVEPVTVSWRAFKDSKKLRDLEAGAGITVRRVESVIAWFSDNWPEETEWPPKIPRPSPSAPTEKQVA